MKIVDKTKKDPSEVVVLLDGSGSMANWREGVVTTFNEYREKLRNQNILLSLYIFDSEELVKVFYKEPTNTVRKLLQDDYFTRAATPLYDAIGRVLNNHPGSSIEFMIHTDGFENASREYSFEQIQNMLKNREKQGCQITWLGEGLSGRQQTSVFVGQKYYFNSVDRGAVMAAASYSSSNYATTGQADNKTEVDVSANTKVTTDTAVI